MQPQTLREDSPLRRFLAGASANDAVSYRFPANYEPDADVPSICGQPLSLSPWEASASASAAIETPEARRLAQSANHKEAERRRRQRINSHLDQLRRLLRCNSKTDKATLLAQVIDRVKELKRQTAELAQPEAAPSEADEVDVALSGDWGSETATFKASFCCEDRSDLIPETIELLRSLRLKALRAEMATMGGRVRNVLVVAGDGGCAAEEGAVSERFLQDALWELVERSGDAGGGRRLKRQRF